MPLRSAAMLPENLFCPFALLPLLSISIPLAEGYLHFLAALRLRQMTMVASVLPLQLCGAACSKPPKIQALWLVGRIQESVCAFGENQQHRKFAGSRSLSVLRFFGFERERLLQAAGGGILQTVSILDTTV